MACVVCYSSDDVTNLPCCSSQVCDSCLGLYINTQLREGNYKVKCPAFRCSKHLNDQTMRRLMTGSMEEKQQILRINATKDPTVKICPKCNFITTRTKAELTQMKRAAKAAFVRGQISHVICERCYHNWCFYCYGPWHEGISCKDFKGKSSNQVAVWSKQTTVTGHQRNAFPCPYCGIFIERSSGCSSMRCTRCHTYWCYSCGKRTRLFIPVIGHHGEKYSVLGCTASWKMIRGDAKFTKRIRWGIFITQIVLIVLITVPFLLLTIPLFPAFVFLGGSILVSVTLRKMFSRAKFRWNTQDY